MTVEELEASIGSKLPDDYRAFLGNHTESHLACTKIFRFTEITPLGDEGFLDELLTLQDLGSNRAVWIESAGMLLIGDNLFSYPTYLCLKAPRVGHVFYFDIQQRTFWDDEQFYRMFKNLGDRIKDYLRMRSNGLLPEKPEGFENFFHVANSFTEFFHSLRDEPEE